MENTMFVLELIGAAAFAISGAMAAIKRKADIFGVVFSASLLRSAAASYAMC